MRRFRFSRSVATFTKESINTKIGNNHGYVYKKKYICLYAILVLNKLSEDGRRCCIDCVED